MKLPRHAFSNITPDMNVDGGPGMTMRQYYKAAAIIGCLAGDWGTIQSDNERQAMVGFAGRIADAMIAEDEETSS